MKFLDDLVLFQTRVTVAVTLADWANEQSRFGIEAEVVSKIQPNRSAL
jgi:hypothetical protein